MASNWSTKAHRTADPLITYMNDLTLRLHPAQAKLIEATKEHEESYMLSSADEMQLLMNLIRALGAKKAIDIGVYTGYSALSMALALPDDGKVIACDITDEYAKIGQPFWKEANVDKKIDLRIAPALETLQKLIDAGEAGTFDVAFIDADKENYINYYELCFQLIRSRGMIVVDNTLWCGNVINENATDKNTFSIRAFNSKLSTDDRVHISMIKLGDGTTLIFKK